MRKPLYRKATKSVALTAILLIASMARTDAVSYGFAGPVFDIEYAPDGSLLVADASGGVFEIRKGHATNIASLTGVTDIAPIGRGSMFAVTSHGFGGDGMLYRVSRGSVRPIADLAAFEATVNPDGGIIELINGSGGSRLSHEGVVDTLECGRLDRHIRNRVSHAIGPGRAIPPALELAADRIRVPTSSRCHLVNVRHLSPSDARVTLEL